MTEATMTAPSGTVPTPAAPSLWPLAEETLAAHPAARDFYANLGTVAALEAPPDVVVVSGIRSAFDQQLENLARGYEADRATVDSLWAEKWDLVFGPGRPGIPAPVAPLRLAGSQPDDLAYEQAAAPHEQASVADLQRWSRRRYEPEPEPDITAFVEAFEEDPEGEADRAELVPLPPERSDDA